MRVVVTGGAGFIGSNLVDSLLSKGNDVIVLDNESRNTGSFRWNMNAENHRLDVTSYLIPTDPLFKEVDVIFHLAARTQIQESIENPYDTFNNNYFGTLNMLEAARLNGIERFVFSSSSAVYGMTPCPHKEDSTIDCMNPYSESKIGGERLCRLYKDLYGVKTVSLRYFNVYGDGMPSEGSYAPVIGRFVKQMHRKKPLTIVGDGNQTRDFVSVKDVVKANVMASITDNEECFGESFNVGTGNSISINEISMMVDGGENGREYLPERQEIFKSECDNSKIRSMMGWNPEHEISEFMGEVMV